MSYKQLGNQEFNYTNKRQNRFENYDDLSIQSTDESIISDSDKDDMSEGYEEIYEILLTNQSNKQSQNNGNRSNLSYSVNDERKLNTLPPIKPTSISQNTSYVAISNNSNLNQQLYYYSYGPQISYPTTRPTNYYSNYGYTNVSNPNQYFKVPHAHQFTNSLQHFSYANTYYNNMQSNLKG